MIEPQSYDYSKTIINKKYSNDVEDNSNIPNYNININQISKIQCPNCWNQIRKTSIFCPECGFKLNRCPICKSLILPNDNQTHCPHCNELFHITHFREAIKVSGVCPLCKFEIKDYEII